MSACVDRYSDEQKQDQTFRFECPKDPIKFLGTFFPMMKLEKITTIFI